MEARLPCKFQQEGRPGAQMRWVGVITATLLSFASYGVDAVPLPAFVLNSASVHPGSARILGKHGGSAARSCKSRLGALAMQGAAKGDPQHSQEGIASGRRETLQLCAFYSLALVGKALPRSKQGH